MEINDDNRYNICNNIHTNTWEDKSICFTDMDLYDVYQPHTDLIIISIFVDEGSVSTIIYANC